MSNVPPPKPTNSVVIIDGDMPWGSVFKLTFKFSVAAFLIWTALSVPFQLLVNYIQQKQVAADREHVREVERKLLGP